MYVVSVVILLKLLLHTEKIKYINHESSEINIVSECQNNYPKHRTATTIHLQFQIMQNQNKIEVLPKQNNTKDRKRKKDSNHFC